MFLGRTLQKEKEKEKKRKEKKKKKKNTAYKIPTQKTSNWVSM